MASLINIDLLMPSSLATTLMRFDSSSDKRNAINGYFDAGLLVLVLVIFFLSFVWVLHFIIQVCLTNNNLVARLFARLWLSDGYMTVKGRLDDNNFL